MSYVEDIYDTPPLSNPTTSDVALFAHHTHLSYEWRPDSSFSFRRGWRVDQTQRLTTVEVSSATFSGGPGRKRVRPYDLTYDPTIQPPSRLPSVQMQGPGRRHHAPPAPRRT